MNKSVKRIGCLLLAAATALPLVGCKGKKANDTETRPVVFATEALDGTFSPFFATSAPDSEIANMTQLGMLTTDKNGNVICGENEPTVALEFKKTEALDQSYTDYEFVIKNDIKFSDGEPLTIKDVLFNLYVYLDPAYMGAATMYSTDIVGLKKYRMQDPEAEDDMSESDFNSRFTGLALARQDDMISYLDGDPDTVPTRTETEIQKDIELLKKLFREEVESDWTASQGSLEGYEDEYTFTETWQVFYLTEGIVRIVTNSEYKPLRDENNKYITNLTPAGVTLKDGDTYDGNGYDAHIVEEIQSAQNDEAKLKEYTDKGASAEDAKLFVTRDYAVDNVYGSKTTTGSGLIEIIQYWASGANLLDKFVAEARTEEYEKLKNEDGSLVVSNISGITTSTKKVDGKTHDVLNIRINGIDPKAEYNFAFAVAPMHYYSGTYEGVDYVKAAKEDTKNEKNFGVAFNNSGFFEKVLQADEKNAKPVGAGAYQASNQKFEAGEKVKGEDFYSNNWVYFARNDYFTTVGDKIDNAKIKYLHYKVVNSDKLIQALEAGDIDVGEPNATATNISTMSKIKHINQKTVDTNGYGYVGINPYYVPDIEVRRVIMGAMETVNCLNYYTKEYASLIYRSMSKSSWIWNYGGDDGKMPTEAYYTLDDMTPTGVQELLRPAGWEVDDKGKLYNKYDSKKTLKLTFTIAGATTDHPAYTMFSEAAELLNECGFEITVTTDISALKNLAQGKLQVWAAAWSSTVDPDMYQVYHKDSKASSTKNWGYPTILNDSTGEFDEEKTIIENLSILIDDGRKTNNKEERAAIYKEALDLVMDLAVEMPTYQRKDCVAYNNKVINPKSLNQDPTAFSGVIDKVWELDYV